MTFNKTLLAALALAFSSAAFAGHATGHNDCRWVPGVKFAGFDTGYGVKPEVCAERASKAAAAKIAVAAKAAPAVEAPKTAEVDVNAKNEAGSDLVKTVKTVVNVGVTRTTTTVHNAQNGDLVVNGQPVSSYAEKAVETNDYVYADKSVKRLSNHYPANNNALIVDGVLIPNIQVIGAEIEAEKALQNAPATIVYNPDTHLAAKAEAAEQAKAEAHCLAAYKKHQAEKHQTKQKRKAKRKAAKVEVQPEVPVEAPAAAAEAPAVN